MTHLLLCKAVHIVSAACTSIIWVFYYLLQSCCKNVWVLYHKNVQHGRHHLLMSTITMIYIQYFLWKKICIHAVLCMQEYHQYFLLTAIALETLGGLLFVLNFKAGAVLLVNHQNHFLACCNTSQCSQGDPLESPPSPLLASAISCLHDDEEALAFLKAHPNFSAKDRHPR